MFCVVLNELRSRRPRLLVSSKPHTGFFPRLPLNLSNCEDLPRLHVRLVDLRQIGMPETSDDLVEESVVADAHRCVPQAVRRQLELVSGLGLRGRRHVGVSREIRVDEGARRAREYESGVKERALLHAHGNGMRKAISISSADERPFPRFIRHCSDQTASETAPRKRHCRGRCANDTS